MNRILRRLFSGLPPIPAGRHQRFLEMHLATWLWTFACRRVESGKARRREIRDHQQDRFFLERYYVTRPRKAGCVYLHRFVANDAEKMHDHPWPYISVVLTGGYWEHTPSGRQWRGPGSIAVRRPRSAHYIRIHHRPCWTLVIRGPRMRSWGFYDRDRRQWTDASLHGEMLAAIREGIAAAKSSESLDECVAEDLATPHDVTDECDALWEDVRADPMTGEEIDELVRTELTDGVAKLLDGRDADSLDPEAARAEFRLVHDATRAATDTAADSPSESRSMPDS